MIILRKSKIILLTVMVMFSTSVYMVKNNVNNIETTVETVAWPSLNKVIVLDAGHGAPDFGASSLNGTTECDINLKITLKVKQLLEQTGIKVV